MGQRTGSVIENALDYGDALPDGGALIGLDLGTKTIGVATCDAGWRYATAGKTIPRSKFAKDSAKLRAIVEERAIVGVVIGLPRNMDGSEGPRAQASRAYARNLAETFALPVLLWDERWSTQAVTRTLLEADATVVVADVEQDEMDTTAATLIRQDMSRAKRAERIDSHAAAIILQGAIDALAGGGL